MSIADLINACFEGFGALFVFLNIARLHEDKLVRGVNWRTVLYFAAWGLWNIYYYASLEQWFSWVAGMVICAFNLVYFGMMWYYIRREKHGTSHNTTNAIQQNPYS